MASKENIEVKPIAFSMVGFKVEDLFIKEFRDILKKELPTSLLLHFCIGFSDSKEIISVTHDRDEDRYELDRVDVEGTTPNNIPQIVEILKKVFS